jgi:hypothetical protein
MAEHLAQEGRPVAGVRRESELAATSLADSKDVPCGKKLCGAVHIEQIDAGLQRVTFCSADESGT